MDNHTWSSSISASSFLAKVIPPISAASKTNETNSKGKTNLLSNISPNSSVDDPEVITTSPSNPFTNIYENKKNITELNGYFV